jgi:hypothetical protein
MSFEEYNRKTFVVTAAQVTLENIAEIALRCGGDVETIPTKVMGTEMLLPCIKLNRSDREGSKYVATLGCYVVELNGSFRVYKPAQFHASFEKKRPKVYRNGSGDATDGIYESVKQDAVDREILKERELMEREAEI